MLMTSRRVVRHRSYRDPPRARAVPLDEHHSRWETAATVAAVLVTFQLALLALLGL
jgi:hypothetical protein